MMTENINKIPENINQADTAEQLGEYRQAFRLLMHAPVAICMLRLPDFVIELANPPMLELWDRDASAVGKKITEVFTEVVHQGFDKLLQYVVATGNTFHEHERPVVILRNGKRDEVFANFVFQPHYSDTGEMVGVLAVANEVTAQVRARKAIAQAQETTRLAVDAAKLGSYEVNLETQEMIVTPRFVQIFGLGTAGERTDYANAIHPEDAKLRVAAHEISLKTGSLEYEVRVIWKDKSIHWIRVTGRVFYDHSGKPVRLLGIVQEITEEKRFSAELKTRITERTRELELANQQLARSNAELEQFAYVTSHDLQEPLRKIQMFSSILLSKTEAKIDASEYTKKISGSAKRMTALITDLLDYSRLSQVEPTFSEIDLNKILNNVLGDFELMIEQKQAEVKSNVLTLVPGIPAQINQLFYNLIGNALKFSHPGRSPKVTITGKPLPAETKDKFENLLAANAYYEISFADNGIGFDQQYADRIFVVFQRLNMSPDYSGHGIGLAICNKIVSNHNGIIYANGNADEGAVFTVILPLNK
ncbi:PAS domain-containing sensor histidine kinase [Flavitalea sp.]|nr:ATP-binding protein [Flavitalea sp.]